MSADQDKDAKTEEPTPKKLQNAVDEGNTPFSREIANFVTCAVLGALCLTVAQANAFQLSDPLVRFLERPHEFRLIVGTDFSNLAWALFLQVFNAIALVLTLFFLPGIAASVLQNTPRMVLKRIQPKWSNISPKQGMKRIFGIRGQFELLKSVIKLVIVGLVGLSVLSQYSSLTLTALAMDPRGMPNLLAQQVGILAVTVSVCFGLLALVDLVWTRRRWHVDLRMTKKEVKDEHKQTEGDPMVRARQRSVARGRARRRMIADVATATVVIANPTHYAVALRYDHERDAAPVVVATGLDLIALKIREVAAENEVPVVEDRELARALYKVVMVDQMIPAEFFKPVAEIISVIISNNKR